MRIITAKQARQFIGKEVLCRSRFSSQDNRVKILGVRGKNVLVDHCGTNNLSYWIRLPDNILESIELPYHEHQP